MCPGITPRPAPARLSQGPAGLGPDTCISEELPVLLLLQARGAHAGAPHRGDTAGTGAPCVRTIHSAATGHSGVLSAAKVAGGTEELKCFKSFIFH